MFILKKERNTYGSFKSKVQDALVDNPGGRRGRVRKRNREGKDNGAKEKKGEQGIEDLEHSGSSDLILGFSVISQHSHLIFKEGVLFILEASLASPFVRLSRELLLGKFRVSQS